MTDRSLRARIERRLARHWASRPAHLNHVRPMVSFSFDDVPQSACQIGRDLLERHGCRGTYYVCAGLSGTQGPDGKMHTQADLEALHRGGHEIACHGHAHLDYQVLLRDAMHADIERNRRTLHELRGADKALNFAYPFGCVSPAVKGVINAAAYRSARGIQEGLNQGQVDLALLKANRLYEPLWSEQRLAQLIEENARNCGWLIFFTHGVSSTPGDFDCSPKLLDFALRAAVQSGAMLLTVDHALNQALAPNESAR